MVTKVATSGVVGTGSPGESGKGTLVNITYVTSALNKTFDFMDTTKCYKMNLPKQSKIIMRLISYLSDFTQVLLY